MKTFGYWSHKISSFSSDQTLIDLLPLTAPSSFRGDMNIQKQRNCPKLPSDSSSFSSDTTNEKQLMFAFTSTSSKQSTGTPMNKLLAREMSKENEPRRRSPSIIARLMGLDGLPPRQHGHKQQNGIESSQGSTFDSWQSSRKSSKDEQEFKDVFEVLDALKMESAGFSQGSANSNLSDAKVAFIGQKFMKAKRLSTDEKLQDSKEFNDTLEVLDSNTDLLLKFFQQPDSLFTKHLHDLRGMPPQSHCSHVSAIKSSRTLNKENGSLAHKNGSKTRTKHHCESPQGHQEGCPSHPHGRCAAHNPPKSPTFQLEETKGQAFVPTRIVVLKPNLGKLQNSSRTSSSPRSSHHFPSKFTRHSEILGVEDKEAEMRGKNNVHQDTVFSTHNPRDSREMMGKEITRKMKNSFNNNSMTISTSKLRGYAGDESSCDVSGSESANDSDVTTLSYRDNIGWNERHRGSSSRSSESSVSREAKNRLSERWKITHKPQEVHVVSRGSTLGEMLANSDREAIPGNSSGSVGMEGCSEVGRCGGPAVWNEPLGISSRDGWKDGCLGNLSRSRSLPASYTDFGSPRKSARHESLLRNKYVIPKEGFKLDQNKAVKGNFNQKEAPLPSNQRSRVKKSQFLDSSCSNKDYSGTSQDSEITPYQVKQNKLSEHILMVSRASAGTAVDSSSVENAEGVNDLNMPVLSEPSNIELSAPASLNAVVASTSDLDNLDSQEPSEGPKQTTPDCPVPELESQVCSKEAEQPSPVSVIEAPFADDASSGSECFESISADLHELRMQLRQLQLESEVYEDGAMLLSSDDDGNVVSVGLAEENGRPKPEENWESVYIVDVLVDSGISRAEPDTFLAAWHSTECPVNPLVFEELEKKYCNLNSRSRADRRLMFDRINSKILGIYQQYRDQPQMISGRKLIIPECNIGELEDSLCKSLVSQSKKPHMDEGETVFAGEFQWLDLRTDVDEIGRGIERLLVDELVSEVVTGL